MKKNSLFIALFLTSWLFLGGASLFAQSKNYKAKVKEMLELTHYKENFEVGIKGMINSMKNLRPNIPKEVWDRLDTEFMNVSMEELMDLLIPVYYEHLDEKTLNRVITFHKSPAGKKLAEKTSLVTQDAMLAGQEWGRKIREELGKKLAEEGY